ncbi:MAG: tetratricopeptide repeat protein [Thioalkalispiraceae bacterium]
MYDLTGSFDDAILDNWLSSYWDCSNHFERVDLKYNNVLYFFSQHSPLVIPIIEQQNKSFRLFYSSQFDFQLDTKKQVLLKKTNKEKSKVMYICDEQVVPQHYRDGYATYRVNQDFLSGHSQGENIAIKDGARFLEQECRRTYQAKEYELARSTCGLAAANEKNVIAKYYLGMLYRYNQGGEIDLEASFKNISDAANAGFSPAFGWLAWHYNFGKSVKKDYREALRWYVAAVDSGEFNLAESVAGFYMYGKGVEVDYKQAAAWLLIAARAGDSHAQNKIGCMFANGVGVRQDYQLAHHWILKSSRQNNPKAIYNLAVLYDAGKIVKNGKGYASELYRKAAKYGLRKSTDITDKLDRVMIQ